jgi:hypothetical protein
MRIHVDENIQVQNIIETDFRKIVNVFNLLCKHVLGEFFASVNYLRGLEAIISFLKNMIHSENWS